MSYCCTCTDELQLTVVMITHDFDSLFRTCNRVGVIVDGRMITDTLSGISPARIPGYTTTSTVPGARAMAAR